MSNRLAGYCRSRWRARVALLAVAGALSAFWQTSAMEDAGGDENDIVVTASRVGSSAAEEPVSVHVIDADEAVNVGTRTVGEALRWVPGVDISGGAPFAATSRSTALFQGLPAQYSLIMVDGQRTKSEHIHTGVNLELIPLNMIERIEVIRGPGSVVNGSDALGGIVNIITKSVPDDPVCVVSTMYGSEDSFNLSLYQGSTAGNFGYAVTADHATTTGVGEGNDFAKDVVRFKLQDTLSDSLVATADISWYEGTYSSSDDSMLQYRIDIENESADAGRLKLEFSQTSYDRTFKSGAATADNDVTGGVVQYDRTIGESHHVITGLEWRDEEFARIATPTDSMDIGSIYVQDAFDIGGHGRILIGIRADIPQELVTEVSPRAAYHWKGDVADLRVSIAKGFRIPSLQELYENGYDHTTYWRYGNPDLDPEKSIHFSVEGNHNLGDSGMSLKWFAFRNDITNMISLVDTGTTHPSDGDPILQRENIKEAYTQGIEVGVIARGEGARGLDWQLTYGYLDAKDATTDTQLAYNPTHSVKGGITYDFGEFSVGMIAEAISDRLYRDKNGLTQELGDYILMDVNVSARLSPTIDLSVSVKNLLDWEFETYEEGKAVASYGAFYAVSLKARF